MSYVPVFIESLKGLFHYNGSIYLQHFLRWHKQQSHFGDEMRHLFFLGCFAQKVRDLGGYLYNIWHKKFGLQLLISMWKIISQKDLTSLWNYFFSSIYFSFLFQMKINKFPFTINSYLRNATRNSIKFLFFFTILKILFLVFFSH